ncbi:MAG TPA: 2-dehydropantoate 2-reductase [bacterium]|nr:2-dehydropantoate 2-reductase [bacterium]
MRVAVMGTGGTGGFYGGLLARAGEEVTFIARGAHLEAIRTRGLVVKSRLAGEFTVRANATDDPKTIPPVDLVLFCVKTYDTEPAAALIRPIVGPNTVILSVQNGIDNDERITRVVGRGTAISAAAQVNAHVEAPGVVGQPAGPGRLIFGANAGGLGARVESLYQRFMKAGIAAELQPDINVVLWSKYLFICGFSGVTALTRLTIGPILACEETRELFRGAMLEVEALAQASGVALAQGIADQSIKFSANLEPWATGSMAHDLSLGRRIEVESLNGTVVRRGRARKVPSPINFAIYAALKPFVNGPPPDPRPQAEKRPG